MHCLFIFSTYINALLILQPFRCSTYVTAHSPTLPLLHLRHSSFSNPSIAPPTSQLILQPFFRFSYVTGSSFTSPGERPMHSGGPGFKSRCRPTWLRFFRAFPQLSRQMMGWIFITTIHSSNSCIIKLKTVNVINETLTTHNNRNTQPSGTHPKTLDAI